MRYCFSDFETNGTNCKLVPAKESRPYKKIVLLFCKKEKKEVLLHIISLYWVQKETKEKVYERWFSNAVELRTSTTGKILYPEDEGAFPYVLTQDIKKALLAIIDEKYEIKEGKKVLIEGMGISGFPFLMPQEKLNAFIQTFEEKKDNVLALFINTHNDIITKLIDSFTLKSWHDALGVIADGYLSISFPNYEEKEKGAKRKKIIETIQRFFSDKTKGGKDFSFVHERGKEEEFAEELEKKFSGLIQKDLLLAICNDFFSFIKKRQEEGDSITLMDMSKTVFKKLRDVLLGDS